MINCIIVYPSYCIVDAYGDCDIEGILVGVRKELCYVESYWVYVGPSRNANHCHWRLDVVTSRKQRTEVNVTSRDCRNYGYDNNCKREKSPQHLVLVKVCFLVVEVTFSGAARSLGGRC